MRKIVALILCFITVLSCIPAACADNAEQEQTEPAADGTSVDLDAVAEAAASSATNMKHKFVVRGAVVLLLGCFVAFVLPSIASKANTRKKK